MRLDPSYSGNDDNKKFLKLMRFILSYFEDKIQFTIEIDPVLESFLGIGLVRNEEYVGIYFNFTALNSINKGNIRNERPLNNGQTVAYNDSKQLSLVLSI